MKVSEGFYHDGHWIPLGDPPKWARCPVCREISPWELGTCPTCEGVILLAIYEGDYLPVRFRNS